MIECTAEGLRWQRFSTLAAPHAVFGRQGGVSPAPYDSLNVGSTVGDAPEHVAANHQRLYRALGIAPEQVAMIRQVHGDQVRRAGPADGGRLLGDADALISDTPGRYLLLRFADCVPVFFCAQDVPAVGLAHAGWPGTLQRVAAKTAQAMVAAFGCAPQALRVGIGPSIGPCCFQVGPEVVEAAREAFGPAVEGMLSRHTPDGRAHLDLWAANAYQLRELGVEQIELAGCCTRCHQDRYFSHRGSGGITGRFAALIGLPAAGSASAGAGEGVG